MVEQMKKSLNLEFLLRRPVEFIVKIERIVKIDTEAVLGLDLDYNPTGKSLNVRTIRQGLVSQWSKMNPGKEIKIRDRIVGVNGYRGDAEKMLLMCKSERDLELAVVRVYCPASAG